MVERVSVSTEVRVSACRAAAVELVNGCQNLFNKSIFSSSGLASNRRVPINRSIRGTYVRAVNPGVAASQFEFAESIRTQLARTTAMRLEVVDGRYYERPYQARQFDEFCWQGALLGNSKSKFVPRLASELSKCAHALPQRLQPST